MSTHRDYSLSRLPVFVYLLLPLALSGLALYIGAQRIEQGGFVTATLCVGGSVGLIISAFACLFTLMAHFNIPGTNYKRSSLMDVVRIVPIVAILSSTLLPPKAGEVVSGIGFAIAGSILIFLFARFVYRRCTVQS